MTNRSCVIRLSRYKNALLRLKALNFVRVFSENLADAAGVSATQVRKDFSIFGVTGNRRGGYKVDELISQLNTILGKDKIHHFVLVGIGNLGRALLRYQGFGDSGIRIVAGFDIDAVHFSDDTEIPVFPLEKLTDFIRDNGIEFAIIAVPDFAAQQVLELMLSVGIKGVLNFAPICLKGPEGCVVNNINLVTEMENIIYFVTTARKTKGN
jgi:redox-sensing transcriptional repressor